MIEFASRMPALATFGILALVAMVELPVAHADNSRFNNSVVSNVYTIQQQAGCTNKLTSNAQLRQAAQWHTVDVLNNRDLNGDSGSDGSTPQDRANAAGFRGVVDETVAINPAIAISGIVTPLIAAAAMSGSSILVMLNALRARSARGEVGAARADSNSASDPALRGGRT